MNSRSLCWLATCCLGSASASHAGEFGLTKTQRRCVALALAKPAAALPAIGENDAFALMDPFAAQILGYRNPRVLAQSAFQPGSLFKVVATYRALAIKRVDPNEVFKCSGKGCWRRNGHGSVGLAKALAYSCNLYFEKLGSELGIGELLQGAREFGLGRSTGSDLPGEVAGVVPVAAGPEDAARLAIGENADLRVTPLQVLSLIGAVANGGTLHSPRVSERDRGAPSDRGILEHAEALRFIRDALGEASAFGTGSAQNLSALRMAGKTGTAAWQKGFRTHAWYMGFAPSEHPLIAIVVFVQRGQGSIEAAGIAGRLIESVLAAFSTCGVGRYEDTER